MPKRTLTRELKASRGRRVKVQGWLHNLRKQGKVNFLILRDRTGIVQAVASPEEIEILQGLQMETVLEIEGTVVDAAPAPGGFELQNIVLKIINPVTDVAPFSFHQKEFNANLPYFLDHAAVGQRFPRQRAILKLAASAVEGFRKTLRSLGFTEIFTPKIVASATESGANVFQIDYFGQPAYLAQSPQFYKQMMVGVFERVFEVAPVFRAEKFDTARHVNEYLSLDAEMGFIENHFSVMDVVSTVIRGMLQSIRENISVEDRELLELEFPAVPDSIPSIYYPEAQEMIYKRYGIDARGEPDLAPEHEKAIGRWAKEEHGSDFVFVPGYPMVKRPFYTHPSPEDPRFSNSFDLLFRGMELVTGGQRLHRYDDYVAALERAHYPVESFKEYLECFKFGMPPHGGFAIGLERFVAQLCRLDNVKWVTLFPRDINRLRP
ncbi:MAG: aspartate--tRNA(Asn) ligase [Anaerolineales bacterium]